MDTAVPGSAPPAAQRTRGSPRPHGSFPRLSQRAGEPAHADPHSGSGLARHGCHGTPAQTPLCTPRPPSQRCGRRPLPPRQPALSRPPSPTSTTVDSLSLSAILWPPPWGTSLCGRPTLVCDCVYSLRVNKFYSSVHRTQEPGLEIPMLRPHRYLP